MIEFARVDATEDGVPVMADVMVDYDVELLTPDHPEYVYDADHLFMGGCPLYPMIRGLRVVEVVFTEPI